MQTAICTHCGNSISRETSKDQWEHDDPLPGLKAGFCRVVEIATPRRGSIKREGEK